MPANNATAGMIATANIQRHTCGSLIVASSSALIERQELACDDHEFVDRHHPPSTMRWRHLGQVERAGRGRRPDTEAEQNPTDRHHDDVRCGGADQGAEQEQARTHQQTSLAPEAVGQLAAQQRTERRPRKQQRTDDERLGERGQVQVRLHVEQGARDHAGVVSEQQTTQGGDHRQLDEKPVVRCRTPGG